MFKSEEPSRKIADMQEQAQSELMQQICDILVAGGYFRARLNIDPFDKILGGMCWSIAGCNFDIDIEFQDDLIMGQKIKLSEKIVNALVAMNCPLSLHPHQIQGLDYAKIYPIMQWLVKKLMESRDTRGQRNKKQGILNYNLKFGKIKASEEGEEQQPAISAQGKQSQDIERLKEIIFRGKPKRVFRTNRNKEVAFSDPKRVHTALREFNDMSASKVFANIIEQIAQFENEERAKQLQFQKTAAGGQGQKPGAPVKKAGGQQTTQSSGAQNAIAPEIFNQEPQTQEEVFASVERMLQNEKKNAQVLPKASAHQEFDLNEGIVSVSQTAPGKVKGAKKGQAGQPSGPGQSAGGLPVQMGVQIAAAPNVPGQSSSQPQNITGQSPIGGGSQPGGKPQNLNRLTTDTLDTTTDSVNQSVLSQKEFKNVPNTQSYSSVLEQQQRGIEQQQPPQFIQDGDDQVYDLDNDIEKIQRQTTIGVRAGNVSDIFMANIDSIASTVQEFQQMSEDTFNNDATLFYQQQKDNYEKQIAKLRSRIDKQRKQKDELNKIVESLNTEVESLEYEREQYIQQQNLVDGQSQQVERDIDNSTVKEHEIMVVTALIDEKARLNEEKITLKKGCRDEKTKLDQELEKMKKRKDEMEKEEHANVLKQIDSEFDAENDKLVSQRTLVADVNKKINILQRKIQNCPSKIEITQFHKRLVELFDNLNLKSEENRRFVNLYNTVIETKKLFSQQQNYMKEINDTYKQSKNKKEKEVLLANIQNVLGFVDKNITNSVDSLNKFKTDYQRVQNLYNDSIMKEKDHYRRMKEFEDECDKNDEFRAKLKGKK